MDKISVIIPCYNVEVYIDRCLESVVNQTIGLDMIEIIAVNDMSTDGTLDKLYEWEKRYPDNIVVITYEEHLHPGGARNLGMEYAGGGYIGFVDADDWIEPNMYELLYEKMSTGKYDLVKCKYIRDFGKGNFPLSTDNRRDVEYHFIPRNGLCYSQISDVGNCGEYESSVVWSGLYKASMLREWDIRFPEHLAFEDNYFTEILQLYVEWFYIVDVALYHYFCNPQSLVNKKNAMHHLNRMPIAVMLVEEFQKRGAFEVYYKELETNFLIIFFVATWRAIFNCFDYIPDIMDEMKKVIRNLFPNYKDSDYVKNRRNIWTRMLEIDNLSLRDIEVLKKAYFQLLEIESRVQDSAENTRGV